jgi:hypothetical protein
MVPVPLVMLAVTVPDGATPPGTVVLLTTNSQVEVPPEAVTGVHCPVVPVIGLTTVVVVLKVKTAALATGANAAETAMMAVSSPSEAVMRASRPRPGFLKLSLDTSRSLR